MFVSFFYQCETFNHVCKFISGQPTLDIATTRLIQIIIKNKGTPKVHHRQSNKDKKNISMTKVRFENKQMLYGGSTVFRHTGAIRNNN